MTTISIIVAVDRKYGIGRNNQLLCHLPADMKRFKQTTSGHTVIMGRKTWDSLKVQPLPNRRNIIITHQKDLTITGAEVVHSTSEALALCQNEQEVFIIGGDSIYRQFYPLANKLYLTRIDAEFDADTFFPEVTNCDWVTVFSEAHHADEKHSVPFFFLTLERIK
jgi:dihydrofolate reductase